MDEDEDDEDEDGDDDGFLHYGWDDAEIRIGAEWQATSLPPLRIALTEEERLQPPPAVTSVPIDDPSRACGTRCYCGEQTHYFLNRWWCPRGGGGCGFERAPPPGDYAPLCDCGEASIWLHGHWWCRSRRDGHAAAAALATLAAALADGDEEADGGAALLGALGGDDENPRGGCDFEFGRLDPERPEPTLITNETIEAELQKAQSVRELAHASNTWIDPYCCVARTSATGAGGTASGSGLGLFARSDLRKGVVITEYGGPRLPLRMLKKERAEYALEVTGTSTFVDGGWGSTPLGEGGGEQRESRPRYPAVFANHSSNPNAVILRRPTRGRGSFELRHRMVLVTLEPIERGGEIRIDYDLGRRDYWSATGTQPPPRG